MYESDKPIRSNHTYSKGRTRIMITLYHTPSDSPRAPWFDSDIAHAYPTAPGSPPWKWEAIARSLLAAAAAASPVMSADRSMRCCTFAPQFPVRPRNLPVSADSIAGFPELCLDTSRQHRLPQPRSSHAGRMLEQIIKLRIDLPPPT